jgi:carbon-monoxide dehydrogenase large subunit
MTAEDSVHMMAEPWVVYLAGRWAARSVEYWVETLAAKTAAKTAALMAVPANQLTLVSGKVLDSVSGRTLTLTEVAHGWYRQPQLLPQNIDPAGLEVTVGYKAQRDTGTFSYAVHACALAVDTELGHVEILDYVICEDGGTLLNPMIVDGQILGGLAQGIGTALYEEMSYDTEGQPLASTLADYLLPGATEVPLARLDHLETPSPYTEFGQKGIGEGGAIAPPAAIVNAINDALASLGVEMLECPVTPRRLREALRRAEASV